MEKALMAEFLKYLSVEWLVALIANVIPQLWSSTYG